MMNIVAESMAAKINSLQVAFSTLPDPEMVNPFLTAYTQRQVIAIPIKKKLPA